MTHRSWARSHRRDDGALVSHAYEELSSSNSPRDAKGQLVLRANRLRHVRGQVLKWSESGAYVGENGYTTNSVAGLDSVPGIGRLQLEAETQAYGRLRGQLYKGNAALGVTFASWRQSQEMIVKRSNFIRSTAEDIAESSSRKKLTRKLANNYLEIIFGWQPLIQDIVASCFTVIQTAFPTDYVRGAGVKKFDQRSVNERPGWYEEILRESGTVRCTFATGVRISNPNLWLMERAGLINLAAIAWDVVPFSFIVNMISNTGSLVNSISDFCGLSFQNGSRTQVRELTRSISYSRTYPFIGSKGQTDKITYKERDLMDPTLPRTLIFRAPNLDWSTAAMAASLMVQQAVPVVRMGKRFKRLLHSDYTE